MSNNKVIGGRSIGGQKRAPAFVDALLELFGDVATTQAFVDTLTGFFATGADAQTTLDLTVATGSALEANGRLIRDSLPNATTENFTLITETALMNGNADFISNLEVSYVYTVI